ncbi:LptA/OstA family protein [Bartonella rattaustraliani]|uniref:LptA/OstA family protein n=1 Tax=Bartonella rattaustraliani TaxID=481139 RepID=UPI0002DB4492|nr:LptA/OstA family protein [Bartonella rattaustraliani]
MKLRELYKKWVSIALALSMVMLEVVTVSGYAEVAHFGINLSNDKKPVEFYANSLEIRDKEGIALFNGDVSVIQGERLLRTAKLVVYYDKTHKVSDKSQKDVKIQSSALFGSAGFKRMEALGKVYIKFFTQTATGDKGVFDGKSKIMHLTGKNVVLTDGDNVATGCKLTADMKSGNAFLEGCKTPEKKGRVSIIFNQSQKSGN